MGCGNNKNIVAVPLKIFPTDFHQETTHESRNRTEKLSSLYDIKELLEGIFLITFNNIDCQQYESPVLMAKLKCATYKTIYSSEGGYTIQFAIENYKRVIPNIIQIHIVNLYYKYLHYPVLDIMEAIIPKTLY